MQYDCKIITWVIDIFEVLGFREIDTCIGRVAEQRSTCYEDNFGQFAPRMSHSPIQRKLSAEVPTVRHFELRLHVKSGSGSARSRGRLGVGAGKFSAHGCFLLTRMFGEECFIKGPLRYLLSAVSGTELHWGFRGEEVLYCRGQFINYLG